jgi:hypothetical protein
VSEADAKFNLVSKRETFKRRNKIMKTRLMLKKVMKHTKGLIALRATRLLIIALGVNLASATLMHAQYINNTASPHINLPYGAPEGVVGWGENAAWCKVLPGSAASTVNYVTGTVTFTTTSFGVINLACPIPGIMNGLSVPSVHDFALNFSDGGDARDGGCTVAAVFRDDTSGATTTWALGAHSFPPDGLIPNTVDVLIPDSYPLLMNHLYEIDITLTRPQTAVGVCFPMANAVYMESL